MEEKFQSIYGMLKKLGFEEFTSLQKEAFLNENLYMDDKNIMVTGRTSSGKTLIPILYYINEYNTKGIVPPMLYAVPYKALALQKKEEIEGICRELKADICVTISSGDYKAEDDDIRRAAMENQIIVIIYEKVFTFSCIEEHFFCNYKYLVLDEFGIIDSEQRGVKADFILVDAIEQESKIFVLTTPYMEWDSYVNQYGLVQIKDDKRPVELREVAVTRTAKRNSIKVDNENPFICSKSGQKTILMNEIIADICEACLDKDMTVIIFKNNRAEVVNMARELYGNLRKRGYLRVYSDSEIKAYKEEVLSNIYCLEEDLNGIFSQGNKGKEEYQALMNGIVFHSAILPMEFREYIEHNWGKQGSKFKIIFSTETLAFGINSNVDIVIIADMVKPRGNRAAFLNKNEYGRAGRMGKDIGYAFALLNSERSEDWRKMKNQSQMAESQFWNLDRTEQPFYLLGLFKGNGYLTFEDIYRKLMMLPACQGEKLDKSSIKQMLNDLVDKRMMSIAEEESVLEGDICYRLCGMGNYLKGYILSVKAYEKIYDEVKKFSSRSLKRHFDFLFGMCGVDDFLQNVIQSCGKVSQQAYASYKRTFIFLLHNKNKKEHFDVAKDRIGAYAGLDESYADQVRISMAMQLWANGANMHDIFRWAKIPYGLIKKIGESLCFYLEIASALMSCEMGAGKEKHMDYLKRLQISIYYGIPVEVIDEFGVNYIKPQDRFQYRSMGRILNFYKENQNKRFNGRQKMEEIKLLEVDLKLVNDENKELLEKHLGRKLQ